MIPDRLQTREGDQKTWDRLTLSLAMVLLVLIINVGIIYLDLKLNWSALDGAVAGIVGNGLGILIGASWSALATCLGWWFGGSHSAPPQVVTRTPPNPQLEPEKGN